MTSEKRTTGPTSGWSRIGLLGLAAILTAAACGITAAPDKPMDSGPARQASEQNQPQSVAQALSDRGQQTATAVRLWDQKLEAARISGAALANRQPTEAEKAQLAKLRQVLTLRPDDLKSIQVPDCDASGAGENASDQSIAELRSDNPANQLPVATQLRLPQTSYCELPPEISAVLAAGRTQLIGAVGNSGLRFRLYSEGKLQTVNSGADLATVNPSGPVLLLATDPKHELEATGSCIGCDLRGVQISGVVLEKVNLSGADLSGADIINSEFRVTTNFFGAKLGTLEGKPFTIDNTKMTLPVFTNATSDGMTILNNSELRKAQLSANTFSHLTIDSGSIIDQVTPSGSAPFTITDSILPFPVFTSDAIDKYSAAAAKRRDGTGECDKEAKPLKGWNGITVKNSTFLVGYETHGYFECTESSRVTLAGVLFAGTPMSLKRTTWGSTKIESLANSKGEDIRSDLSNANFDYANLEGISLKGSRLINASMVGTDLGPDPSLSAASNSTSAAPTPTATPTKSGKASDLRGVDMRYSSFDGAIFVSAVLGGDGGAPANLEASDLRGTNFTGAKLIGANLTNSYLFTGTTGSGVTFNQADLTRARFNNSLLAETSFTDADLNGVNFTGAQCINCKFSSTQAGRPGFADNVHFDESYLYGSILYNISFPNGSLINANADNLKTRSWDWGVPTEAKWTSQTIKESTILGNSAFSSVEACPNGLSPSPTAACEGKGKKADPEKSQEPPACVEAATTSCATWMSTLLDKATLGHPVKVAAWAGLVKTSSGSGETYKKYLYVSDSSKHVVIRYDVDTRTAEIFAGKPGVAGSTGDGGDPKSLLLNSPNGLAVDAKGQVFLADTGNHRILKISPEAADDSLVARRIAGLTGQPGPAKTGSAMKSPLNRPEGVSVSCMGLNCTTFIADTGNRQVLQIDPTGRLSTVAGKAQKDLKTPLKITSCTATIATSTILAEPTTVIRDSQGVIYIANRVSDSSGQILAVSIADKKIRCLPIEKPTAEQTSGNKYYTFGAMDLTLDPLDNLYIADSSRSQIIRSHLTSDGASGVIIANTEGAAGSTDDPGDAKATKLNHPSGLAYTPWRSIAISDTNNKRLRSISRK